MLFKDVIGQDNLKARLLHSLRERRISHAQLFLGESGVGPLPLALAYAQYVNCKNPGPEDSCGNCQACRMTTSLEYPDLHFSYPFISSKASSFKTTSTEYLPEWRAALKENPYMDYNEWMSNLDAENKQGNITTFECHNILKKLSLKPMYEGHKILILWLPEYLSVQGNILLKSLEEPPENTLFLLVAQKEDMILPTILSRTQMIRIPRLSDEVILNTLMEKEGLTQAEAASITLLANGNYNTALQLNKSAENNFATEFIDWMRLCFRQELPGIIRWVDAMSGTGREYQKNFMLYAIALIRECLLLNKELPQLNRIMENEKKFVGDFAPFITEKNIYQMADGFNQAYYYIERNANPKILFFNLSLLIHELLQKQKKRA